MGTDDDDMSPCRREIVVLLHQLDQEDLDLKLTENNRDYFPIRYIDLLV